ncbi:MAG TPA: type II toxin-antitoxin system RelE/ParE family toxin [Patescibacteria group bacterium]|nr:type II toxin-antitoxin system RelE/ParE family toxin [Patescibacteria group bacterium]
MPKHEIHITEAAVQDLTDMIEYISFDNPSAALQLADDIERQVYQLEDFPLLGTIPKNRRLANKGYSMLIANDYLVFYIVSDAIVEIRRIISGKRHYSQLL